MPAINIGDFQIMVQTVQETQPSLKIMNHDGEIFYVGMSPGACPNTLKISDGQNVYSLGSSNLYWQATSFNECESVELEPGCYHVELRGGAGGDGGNNADTGTDAVMQSYDFTITETVKAYVLRGGDGADGSVNVSSSGIYSGGGGGASGVPSLFQIGTEYVLSQGGDGGIGGGGYNSSKEEQECGAGGGASVSAGTDGLIAMGSDSWGNTGFVCGGGGGGAVKGSAGAASSGFLYNGSAGSVATDTAGGDGGNSSIGGLFGTSSAQGGAGGVNVSYSCGSQVVYSYGGGGGGAVSTGGLFGTGVSVNGGAGGSGSSGTSDTSYVKIYRFG